MFGSKKGKQEKLRSGDTCVLMIRFDIDRIEQETGSNSYGYECYKKVFKSIRLSSFVNQSFYMGDSQATLDGTENVCIIAIEGRYEDIKVIEGYVNTSESILSVCSQPPTVITKQNHNEPLVYDGYITISSDAPFSNYGKFEEFVAEQNAQQAARAFKDGVAERPDVKELMRLLDKK